MATSAPFRRGRFEDLPEAPRVPHVYGQSTPLDLDLDSAALGARMRVHVRRYGEGPPLLLVHGLMTSSYSWRYALEGLGRRFTCYAPDLPRNGATDGPLAPRWTPAVLGRWLGEVQRALGVRGAPVVANSMGGYLAMHLALEDPEAMARLVNVHAPGIPEPRLYALGAALRVPGARALLRALVRRDPERWAHRHVHYYDESLKSREEARAYGAPLASREGAEGLCKYLGETMATGPMRAFHARLAARRGSGQGFPVPLLLLYAAEDPMVPPRFGEAYLRAVPDARLVRLERASHFCHVDAVDRFLPPVLAFLDEASTGPTATA